MPQTRADKRKHQANTLNSNTKRQKFGKWNEICERCIKATNYVKQEPRIANGGNIITLVNETHDDLRSSKCSFCRLLASIKKAALDEVECELRAFSSNQTFARVRPAILQKYKVSDSVVLGFVPSPGSKVKAEPDGFIGALGSEDKNTATIGPRRIQASEVSYATIQAWISFCQSKHKRLCMPTTSTNIPALKVIDITTQKVVAAPKRCEYVALSYVWGVSRQYVSSSIFPKVVKDSLVITSKLGYKYLWVDKYVSPH